LLAAWPAQAAGPYDPTLTWATVESPRFAVHYPDGGRNLAIRVSRIAEEVIDPITELFGFIPEGRIEIVLSDASDDANGSAQVMPKNILRLYLAAPTELTGLSSYDDWLRILITHELAHICDLDQTHGFTRFLRWIFGKYISWNGFTPQFLTEGVAVYAETVLSQSGRGRSSYVAMLLRMAALEDQFFRIDQAHLQVADWPGGNVPYFYGGFFHLWLAQHFGRDAVAELHRRYASTLIPYVYWFGAEAVFGDSLPDLWEEWRQEELAFAREVAARVEAEGVTPSRRITFHGRNIAGARYHPSGEFIIYSRTSPVDGSTVRAVGRDGTADHHLVLETYSPRFALTRDGASFFFSQAAINERFNDFNDLYRYDFATEEVTRLGDVADPEASLRARDPDVSADGTRLVFVQNRLHQSWVSVGRITGEERDQLEVTVLVPPQGDMQHASPRFSPDGTKVAISTWFEGGFRDIVVVDAGSGALLERVTRDAALDGNPAWSPDGRFLLYESDADGISNLYAHELGTERFFRLTRVVGGAFQADVSADGRSLLFRNATGNGFDIHEMPFAPQHGEVLTYDPARGYRREGEAQPITPEEATAAVADMAADEVAWGTAVPREAEPAMALRAGEVEAPYSPWGTLLPFQDNWLLLPAVFLSNDDPTLQLTTIGQDVLGEHTWQLGTSASWYGRRPNVAAAYFNDQWYPTFGVAGGDQVQTFSRGLYQVRRSLGVGSVTLPIKLRHLLGLSYVFEHRTGLTEAARDELSLGDFAWLELGYTYRFTRRFPYSVGDEHGVSVAGAGRWYSEALGADFDEVLLTLDGRAYVNNPLFDNHVLALRAVAALALGPDFEEEFILGGAQGVSFFSVATSAIFPLRGFALDVDRFPAGRGLFAGYVEYRLPLWHVERGLWTVPVYVERLHLGLFADAGNTFGNGAERTVRELGERAWRRLRGLRLGTGAELRADLSLGWAFPLTLRGGLALPVLVRGRPTGAAAWRERQIYLSFGTAL
jgi:hypothetical protein